MAEACHRRSRSICSNRSARSQSGFSKAQNNEQDDALHRCTCAQPPSYYRQPSSRATIQHAQAIPHSSILSRSFFDHPASCRSPILPNPTWCQDTCYDNYIQFSAPIFSRYNHSAFPQCEQRTRAIFTPSQVSRSYQSSCYSPHFAHAQTFHPDHVNRNPDRRIRRVAYLRAHRKHCSELFVAEYSHLQRLHRFPTLLAQWQLPSCDPYYSVVLMRSQIQKPICYGPLQNLCVATIGGCGKQKEGSTPHSRRSIYDFMGLSQHDVPAYSCHKSRRSRSKKISCNFDESLHLRANNDSIGISEAPPFLPSCSSFSESLTFENNVYDSEDPRAVRRKPFNAESSTSTFCNSSTSSRYTSGRFPKSSTRPSAVKHDSRKRTCRYCGNNNSNASTKSGTNNSSEPRDCSGREAIEVLQGLEKFFGLKNTMVSCALPVQSSSNATSNPLAVSTASPICPFFECYGSSGCIVHDRTFLDSKLPASDASISNIDDSISTPGCSSKDYDSSLGCSSKPQSMISVPSIHGSTAHELICSPLNPSSNDYCTAPNYSPNWTVSGPREDSRSEGRGHRRPSSDAICGDILCQHSLSNTTETAQPMFDPGCNRCAEARLADRLCETLNVNCSCTPIIRTDPSGRISFIDTTLYTPVCKYKDAVMDQKNKKSLSKHIAKLKDKGVALTEAVMQWVKNKSAKCTNEMNKLRKSTQ